MKKRFYIILVLTLAFLFSTPTYAWRIVDNVLIIEKGDNLSDISHALLGRGTEYDLIWKRGIDKLISTNPNKIYDGMRFPLDTLLGPSRKNNQLKIVYVDNKEKESIKLSDLMGLLGVFLGAVLSYVTIRLIEEQKSNEDKKKETIKDAAQKNYDNRKNAFDMLSEFNSSEMHLHRINADGLIANNIDLLERKKKGENITEETFTSYNELAESKLDKRSLFMVINFYKKLRLMIRANRIDEELTAILFGEIFSYWDKYCFLPYFDNDKIEATKFLKDLSKWFKEDNQYITDDMRETWADANNSVKPRLRD